MYANIDQAYQEGENELSRLRRPFRIEISKTKVISNYRVYYVAVSNETVVTVHYNTYSLLMENLLRLLSINKTVSMIGMLAVVI